MAPGGLAQGIVEHSAVCGPSFLITAGRPYDLTFDRHYPASLPASSVSVVPDGDYPTPPVFTINGPATGATITVTDADGSSAGRAQPAGRFPRSQPGRYLIVIPTAAHARSSTTRVPTSTACALESFRHLADAHPGRGERHFVLRHRHGGRDVARDHLVRPMADLATVGEALWRFVGARPAVSVQHLARRLVRRPLEANLAFQLLRARRRSRWSPSPAARASSEWLEELDRTSSPTGGRRARASSCRCSAAASPPVRTKFRLRRCTSTVTMTATDYRGDARPASCCGPA